MTAATYLNDGTVPTGIVSHCCVIFYSKIKSVFGIAFRLWTGRSEVWIPARK